MRPIIHCAAALFLVACEATDMQQPSADSVALAARIAVLTDSMRVNYWERQLDYAREVGDTALERQIVGALGIAREGKAPPPVLLTAADSADLRQRLAGMAVREQVAVLETQLTQVRAAGNTELEQQILVRLEGAKQRRDSIAAAGY